jgi:hypothetical protein
MKPSALRALIIAGAAGGLLWTWYLLSMGEEMPSRTGGRDPQFLPPLSRKGLTALEPAPHTGSTDVPPGKDKPRLGIEQWLEGRGRDARGLIAVWEITGRKDLLKEAVLRFPDNPTVCLAMIATLRNDSARPDYEERLLPWIERLMTAEPRNAEGMLLRSQLFAKRQDWPAAFAAVRDAMHVGGRRDNHLSDRVATIREALETTGASSTDPWTLALRSPFTMAGDTRAISLHRFTLTQEINAANAAGDKPRAQVAADIGLAVAEQYADTWGRSLRDEMEANYLVHDILAYFTDDTPIGQPDATVGGIRRNMEENRATLQQLYDQRSDTAGLYNNATLATQTEYARLFMEGSERQAAEWLRARPADSPPPAPPPLDPARSQDIIRPVHASP